MKKDLIISSLSKNYLWSELKCWINSIKKTNFFQLEEHFLRYYEYNGIAA